MFSFDQLSVPLVQAPMAGGINTPGMAAEVMRHGGVGSFGFAYTPLDGIARDLAETRALSAGLPGAINANFFVFAAVAMPGQDEVEAALASLVEASGQDAVDFTLPQPPYFPNLEQQLDAALESPPDIITFHFGIPDASLLEKLKSRGITIGITATSVEEARQIENAGANFIVAQGIEAGGHRGIFDPEGDAGDDCLETLDLVRVLRREITLPLAAAGGIGNQQQVRAALDAGAAVVQVGTAFVSTHESGAVPVYKATLTGEPERGTCLTRGFSGRRARGIENAFIRAMQGKPVLPFPLQNTLTGRIRAAAVAAGDPECQSLWAGTGYANCRDESIAELIERLFPG